jgi:hypothetical protein
MEAIEAAFKAGRISQSTVENYRIRLNRMASLTGKGIDEMLMDPQGTFKVIKKHYSELQSQRAMLGSFLALFKHIRNQNKDKKLTKKQKKIRQKWLDAFNAVDAVAIQKYMNNEPSQRQADSYMSLQEIVEKRDGLARDSQEFLILSMYTEIPTLRADFGNMRILSREPQGAEASNGNYIVLKKAYARMVLNEFKSKCPKMLQYNKILPRRLEEVIRSSLQARPRSHLVVSPRTGKPFASDHSYIVYVNNMFERVLGKRVTISLLRHIYITAKHTPNMTTGEKLNLSRSMLHSMQTADTYRLIFKDRQCECKCEPLSDAQ